MKKKCALVLGKFRLPKALRSRLAKASDWLWFFSSRGQTMQNEERIMLLVLIIVAGFCIAVAYHYVMGCYLGKPWPANSFLDNPDIKARFFDFYMVVRQSAALDPLAKI